MPEIASQAEPVCRQCEYNLRGLGAVALCPECGQENPVVFKQGPKYSPWLHRYAILFVCMTFGLIMLGGTVTSKGAGLAVPDYPTTFGHNMFLFPPSQWVGGIFWEHTHRLMGSLVGMMAIGMAVWLWRTQRRQVGGQHWLRYFGVATLVMVIIQGLMGGFRVTELSIVLAVIHGITAQLFLCMTVLIAAATSRWWIDRLKETPAPRADSSKPLPFAYAVLGVVVVQLILGASMRHSGAGLAIPDFPTSYGSVIPPFGQDEIESAMIAYTADDYSVAPNTFYKPGHVAIHFSHRVFAIVVAAAVIFLGVRTLRRSRLHTMVRRSMLIVLALLLMQVALGASVIWTGRHPEVATAHQAMGAVLLANLFLLVLRMQHLPLETTATPLREASPSPANASFGMEAAKA